MLLGILNIQVHAGELGYNRRSWRISLSICLSLCVIGKHWFIWMKRMCLCKRARSVVIKTARVSIFLRRLECNQRIMFLSHDQSSQGISYKIRKRQICHDLSTKGLATNFLVRDREMAIGGNSFTTTLERV